MPLTARGKNGCRTDCRKTGHQCAKTKDGSDKFGGCFEKSNGDFQKACFTLQKIRINPRKKENENSEIFT